MYATRQAWAIGLTLLVLVVIYLAGLSAKVATTDWSPSDVGPVSPVPPYGDCRPLLHTPGPDCG